jgi:hypothetical protein
MVVMNGVLVNKDVCSLGTKHVLRIYRVVIRMPTVAGPPLAVLEGAPIAQMMGLQDSKRAVAVPVTVPGPPLAVL